MKKLFHFAAVLITASIFTVNCVNAQDLTASMNVLRADDTSATLHFTINCQNETTTVKIDVINIATNENVHQMPPTSIGPSYSMFNIDLDSLDKASGYRVLIKLGTWTYSQMEYFNTTGTADTTITTDITDPEVATEDNPLLDNWIVVELTTGRIILQNVTEVGGNQELHAKQLKGNYVFQNTITRKTKKFGFN